MDSLPLVITPQEMRRIRRVLRPAADRPAGTFKCRVIRSSAIEAPPETHGSQRFGQ